MKALSPSSSSHTGVTRFRVTPYTLPASSARPLSTTAASSSLSLPSRDPSTVFFPTTLPTRQAYLHPKTAKPLTAFQWKVYDLTYQIPQGRTTTYGALAAKLDTSPRAVGTALSKNPFCPLVPCHRVVAADGSMGGFMGETAPSGLQVSEKVAMLRAEGVALRESTKGKQEGAWAVKSVDEEGGKAAYDWK